MSKSCVLIFFAFLVLFSCKSVSQRDLQKGQRQVDNLNYFLGVDYFLKSWDRSPQPESARALAQAYYHLRDFAQAEEWYNRLSRDGQLVQEDLIPYAEVLISNSNYSEAVRQLGMYQDKDDQRVRSLLNTANQATGILNKGSLYSVSALSQINTNFDEIGPQLIAVDTLLFVSDRLEGKVKSVNTDNALKSDLYGWTGNGFLKVYEIAWDSAKNSTGTETQLSETFQSKLHIGPVFSTEEMDFATITQQQKFVKPDRNSSSRDYTLYPEILFREKSGETGDFQSMQFSSPFSFSVSDPFYDTETKRLYFSSDMPGGFGGADIYYATYLGDGKWSSHENLGEPINTAGDERSPFLDNSGLFYFSSDGHSGLGGLDVYVSEQAGDSLGTPRNLGSPINSNRDDFGFSKPDFAPHHAFFSSDRVGGKGLGDIYLAKEREIHARVEGKVYDEKTNELLSDAVVTLADQEGRQLGTFVTVGDGRFTFSVDPGRDLALSARKTAYLSSGVINVSIPDLDDIQDSVVTQDLFLNKIEVGRVYVLENIYYDFDKWNIRKDAKVELDKLLRIMTENPTLKIELYSHTDSRGSGVYNLKLSDKRANSVVAYLESKGVAAGRMKAIGYGEKNLLNSCEDDSDCSEELHQKNRRTEFKIVEY